jgi:monovalent cation:proton antiporter-2 (CPA2) family protein
MTIYFVQAFIYLAAAVVCVPIAKKLGLGSVLGYLIAGVLIGPVIGLVGQETTSIQHFAEFGVVMMLFLVGLELEPKMLWNMKSRLLGLGGLQIILSAGLAAFVALAFDINTNYAIAIGLIFALSSTAIVLQTFSEKGLTKTIGGQNAFSVLLMQDIAVIPMLAFLPLLALPELVHHAETLQSSAAHHEISLVEGMPTWLYTLVILGSIVGLVVGGHFLSRPVFHFVASSGLREIFVATALLLVVGIAALMSLIGLSPALGTFLAGVVLANSEFKHELESNIEPFKGLLLGLFFITVGAGINFSILIENFGAIIAITAAVIVGKAAILMLLGWVFKIKGSDRWLMALSLAQAGEFGFVLLSFSQQNAVLPNEYIAVLQLVVALSMFLTPILFIVFDKVILPRYMQQSNDKEFDDVDEKGQVIIAGIGRFGQIVNRMLVANGIKTVVLDHEAAQVETLRRVEIKSYFGDATRPDLLHTAGIEEAAMIVVAIDNKEEALQMTHYVKHHFPKVKVLARAFDRRHSYELRHAGADHIVSETYYSALEMGAEALRNLKFHPFDVEQKKHVFTKSEVKASQHLYDSWQSRTDGERFDQSFRKLFIQLEQEMKQAMQFDRRHNHLRDERGWTPPPRNYDKELKDCDKANQEV